MWNLGTVLVAIIRGPVAYGDGAAASQLPDGLWYTGLGGLVAAILMALGHFIPKVIPHIVKARGDIAQQNLGLQTELEKMRRQAYEDSKKDMESALIRVDKDLEKKNLVIEAQERRINEMFEDIREMTQSHADCIVKNERLLSRVIVLEARLETMQVGQEAAGGITSEAIVVVNQKGQITEYSPAAQVLFQWNRAEVMGKSVEMLIAPEARLLHKAAFTARVNSGQPTPRGPVRSKALTKGGDEVDVEVALSGWVDRGAQHYAAAIRKLVVPPRDEVHLADLAVSAAVAEGAANRVLEDTQARKEIESGSGEDAGPEPNQPGSGASK